METYTDTAHYRNLILNQSSMKKSMTELAYHLWPKFPPEIGNVGIGEILGWVKGMRKERASRMLKECGLNKATPLDCIPASERKWMADDLLMGPKSKR